MAEQAMNTNDRLAGWGNYATEKKPVPSAVQQNETSPESGEPALGRLQGTIDAEIHSNQALMLINGRRGPGGVAITGLMSFAKKANSAYSMSGMNDPFADYFLIQVENRVEEIIEQVREVGERYHAVLDEALANEVRGTDGRTGRAYLLSETVSAQPKKFQFRFGHHASRALYVIVQFDRLAVLIMALAHQGIIDRDAGKKEIDEVWKMLRGMLGLGHNWIVTNCRRQDLKERNSAAVEAIRKLSEKNFVDMRMFGGPEEMCDYFAEYPRPKSAPTLRQVPMQAAPVLEQPKQN